MTETRTQDDEDEDEDEMEMTIEVATEATQGCDATRRLARQNCTSRCIGVKLVDLVFSHVPCAQAQRRHGVQCYACIAGVGVPSSWTRRDMGARDMPVFGRHERLVEAD